jgi:hypothetical protein
LKPLTIMLQQNSLRKRLGEAALIGCKPDQRVAERVGGYLVGWAGALMRARKPSTFF